MFQKPSLHGLIFGAKLSGVSVKLPPTDGAAVGGVSLTPVQDLWERSFKEVGEDNPEQTVTGMLIFYPFHLVGYLEVLLIFFVRITKCFAELNSIPDDTANWKYF